MKVKKQEGKEGERLEVLAEESAREKARVDQMEAEGHFKVNLELAIFGCDLENEISVCVRNWRLKT